MKPDCTTCYIHDAIAIKASRRDGRCKVARCKAPATEIVAVYHPTGGLSISEACEEHRDLVQDVFRRERTVPHAPKCEHAHSRDGSECERSEP
jgi:hypothetical protein